MQETLSRILARHYQRYPQLQMVDEISPSGEIVRVHLRPYMAVGHDPERLLEAFLRTAREYRGSVARLQQYGQVAEWMASAVPLPFQSGQFAAFIQGMERDGFPAAHHSQIYEELYRPAYRVVSRTFLKTSVRA